MRTGEINPIPQHRVSDEVVENSCGNSFLNFLCLRCDAIAKSKIEHEMPSRGYSTEAILSDKEISTDAKKDEAEPNQNWLFKIVYSIGKSIEEGKRDKGRLIIQNHRNRTIS